MASNFTWPWERARERERVREREGERERERERERVFGRVYSVVIYRRRGFDLLPVDRGSPVSLTGK